MALGKEPFKEQGAEDSYCCSLLSLLGPIVYCSAPLVAYRTRPNSLSANHVWTFGVWVRVFELLEERFRQEALPKLQAEFRKAFAAKRRRFAKLLMGAERTSEARVQLSRAIRNSFHPISVAKTAGMLGCTYLLRPFQPKWPAAMRAHDSSVAAKPSIQGPVHL